MKVLRSLTKDLKKNLKKEFKVLKTLSHKNIVKVFDFIDAQDALVLELCGITCDDNVIIDIKDWARHCVKKQQVTDYQVIEQISSGLSYLHKIDVIHCDLKSSNCLVKGQMEAPIVKVADFGVAYFQTVTQTETLNSQECY